MGRQEESDCSTSYEETFHVVAVDDSVMNLKLVARLLSRCGLSITVTALESPQEALAFLKDKREARVDMVISDYSMPLMTGYELLTEIKGCCALRDIPVVIMSSENVVSRIRDCMEQGAEDFLIKPLNISKLSSLTTRILKKTGASSRHEHCPLKRKAMVGNFVMSPQLPSSHKKGRLQECAVA